MSFFPDKVALVLVKLIGRYLTWGAASQWSRRAGCVTCLFAQKVTILQYWKLSGMQWPKPEPSEVNVMLWKTKWDFFFFFQLKFESACLASFFFAGILVLGKSPWNLKDSSMQILRVMDLPSLPLYQFFLSLNFHVRNGLEKNHVAPPHDVPEICQNVILILLLKKLLTTKNWRQGNAWDMKCSGFPRQVQLYFGRWEAS